MEALKKDGDSCFSGDVLDRMPIYSNVYAKKYNIMTFHHPDRFLRTLACWTGVLLLALSALVARADTLDDAHRLLKQGQFGPALEKTDQILASKPKDAQARFLKGLILTEMNRYNEAIAVFTKLTEDYPELPEPYNNLAVLYAQQKQYEKAKNALEMAIRTHPSYATAHENLGDIYARMASQAYDKALQIDSSNTSAQSKLALIRDLMSASAPPSKLARAPADTKNRTASAPAAKVEPSSSNTAKTESAAPASKPEPEPNPKVADAKIQTGSDKAAEKNDERKTEVEKAVRDWASAWSRKDVKSYLTAYAPDFRTPGNKPRKDWEAERNSRIAKPVTIQVTLQNVQISVEGDQATAKFRQFYQSGKLKTAANKTLVLKRYDNKWLIQQERITN